MKLYGHPQTSSTRKVLMTLAEKGAALEFACIDLPQGEHGRPAHLARHPFGKVPVLEDGAFLLYEAAAIMRYLDALLPGSQLVPIDLRERARMEQWLSVESAYLAPAVARLTTQLRVGPLYGLRPDPSEVEEARQEVGSALDVIERALSGRVHLVGGGFSLADIALLVTVCALFELRQGDLVRVRSNLLRWWRQGRARASFRSALSPTDHGSSPWGDGAPLLFASERYCAHVTNVHV